MQFIDNLKSRARAMGAALDPRTNAAALRLNYDAVTRPSTRRQQPRLDNRAEDRLLRPYDRDKVISDTRAIRRNSAEVGWMIRRHLDYVSKFAFKCNSGDPALDTVVTALVERWSRPINFDVSGRFSLQKFVRLAEALRTVDGDCFVLKLSDGRVQMIEGDRVRNPGSMGTYSGPLTPADFVHGVYADDTGRHLKYAICDRISGMGNGYELSSVVLGKYVLQHCYRDRYDQIRGVSPIVAALNQFYDLYEAREYALAKMKLSQLFALKFKRSADTDDEQPEADGDPYKFSFGGGPQVIDLDPGDEAEFLESGTPSNEFQTFWQTGLQVALKSLDIPFSFYAEDYTNYSGARQALLQYEQSADDKRADNIQLLNNLTAWRLGLFIADGELTLPAGKNLNDLHWDWLPAGLPWIDPLKEAQADVLMVDNLMASRSALAKGRGEDWLKTVKDLAAENKLITDLGLMLPPKGGSKAPANDPPTSEENADAQSNGRKGK